MNSKRGKYCKFKLKRKYEMEITTFLSLERMCGEGTWGQGRGYS